MVLEKGDSFRFKIKARWLLVLIGLGILGIWKYLKGQIFDEPLSIVDVAVLLWTITLLVAKLEAE